ncbi:Panacea domain-containing protein [Facklamia sp. P13069]|uniref:Panacea domain-containing protein n=1 Tax=Facklamia sp. P13069 TaxID=3421954 RepID=UPI003D163D5D
MTMRQFSDHVIAVSNKNGIPITNLALQKVMYFALKNSNLDPEFLAEIYSEPFKVWRYGPVVESEYNRFRQFSSAPIDGDFEEVDEYNVLNDEILKAANEKVFRLVERSHNIDFWINNSWKIDRYRSDVEYPLEHFME